MFIVMQDIDGLSQQIFEFFERATARANQGPATPRPASHPGAAGSGNDDFVPRVGPGNDIGDFALLILQIIACRQPCIAHQEDSDSDEDRGSKKADRVRHGEWRLARN